MKKIFYIVCASLMLASTCIVPVKAHDLKFDTVAEVKTKAMGVGLLALAASYGYAIYQYGAAQVNAIGLGLAATVGGLLLGNKLAAGGVAVTLAQASQATFSIASYTTSPLALITAAVLGGVTYKTVYDFLDTSNNITIKKIS